MTTEARRVGFLLLPGTHPGAMMPALSVLLSANRMAEQQRYVPETYTLDANSLTASDGLSLAAAPWQQCASGLAQLWLVADQLPASDDMPKALLAFLQQALAAGVFLGGLEAGVAGLAVAGLLDQRRCAVHWRMLDEFRERFPDVEATTHLFELGDGFGSSSGGQATTDLFLTLLAQEQGQDLAALVAEDLVVERIRDGSERQRMPLRNRLGSSHPKLTQAVILMESNIEEPLTTDEIARHVCVSRRQLERIFKQYLNSVPSQYYLELRLTRARQMLLQTSKSIIQIGLSCGFSSGPHFSSAYRNCFGVTPREDRNHRRAQQAAESVAKES
ncbi:MAG TPA: GlxA family transcriptional regulator [Pseudomonas sabulinigri]|uniref:HTH araC/xylS-type domain-containing protein n=1 Tax=marine sediment metagenome TaxID=412755 RepID=A0A0F9V6Z0_9ZZZZ|nr:GlxA family transcriptional regulator [Halopseudomonas sabulinigri]HEC50725.1 GlxA family transcriptional regulator [Halopseudomonas sabulinigri]|tara:strand:- start:248 stop:1240 length:993 start_codon:yes stop_codon:yes gene_type:complete